MKNRSVAILLAFFLGGFGAHKFYLGQTVWGILYLLFFWTFIPAFIALIEFFILLLTSDESFNLRFNRHLMPAAASVNQAQNITIQMPGPMPSHAPAGPPNNVVDQLGKLNELRISGALSEEEFRAQKARLLQG